MANTALEERLEAITREFLRQIVATIRSASFADVAGYGGNSAPERASAGSSGSGGGGGAPRKTRAVASPKRASSSSSGERERSGGGDQRQTADRRAELGERVLETLRTMGEPMGVRQLSSEMGVPVDLLQTALLELRAAGRVAKHGEKRATTYSLT